MATISDRTISKPSWRLFGNSFRGVNQHGETALVFSSVVLVARKPLEKMTSVTNTSSARLVP